MKDRNDRKSENRRARARKRRWSKNKSERANISPLELQLFLAEPENLFASSLPSPMFHFFPFCSLISLLLPSNSIIMGPFPPESPFFSCPPIPISMSREAISSLKHPGWSYIHARSASGSFSVFKMASWKGIVPHTCPSAVPGAFLLSTVS